MDREVAPSGLELEYNQFGSNKFSLDTFLTSNAARNLNEQSIADVKRGLENANERAKRDALRVVVGSFTLLADTVNALDTFNKGQLPDIRERTHQISEQFREFQENFQSLVILERYSKDGRRERRRQVMANAESSASALDISEDEWMQKRSEFEALAGLLENFYAFTQDKERYLVAKCAGVEEIFNPVMQMHPPESCMFFLCNDVLLVGFQSRSQPDRITVQSCFNLLDIQIESYANELRISLSPQLAYEYKFATVDFLSAFLEVLNSTLLAHRKDIIRYLYKLIKHKLEDEKHETLNGFVAKNRNVEVFKRKNQMPTATMMKPVSARSREWSLSKLHYLYQQIQNIEEFINQIDFDKAVNAALSARLSHSNLTLIVGDKGDGHGELLLFLSSIEELLQAKVDLLYKTLCTEYGKSLHSKTKTMTQLQRLVRLGYAEQARNIFLQSRSEFIALKTSQTVFDSTIQNYVSTFCRTTFSVLRSTIQTYCSIFGSVDTMHLVEWCDSCLLELVYKLRRHLFNGQNSFSSICESIGKCFKECDDKLADTGVFLSPFLENYFMPDLLVAISQEEEKIAAMIPTVLTEESMAEPDKEISDLLLTVCSGELANLLVNQLMRGSQPFKSACHIFTEIHPFLWGICETLPMELIGFASKGLIRFSKIFIETLGNEQERIFEALLCLQIFFSKIFPQFQLMLEGKAGKPLSDLNSFYVGTLEPLIFQTLKPKFKDMLVPLTSAKLLSDEGYMDDSVFVESEIKKPTRPIVYFCETVNYFYQLDKFELLNNLFEQLNFPSLLFPLKGLHLFITDLFYLQTVTSAESVVPALTYAFQYYKKNLDNSPVIYKAWTDDEFYTNYLQFLQPSAQPIP